MYNDSVVLMRNSQNYAARSIDGMRGKIPGVALSPTGDGIKEEKRFSP
jgi:hypothetical protein